MWEWLGQYSEASEYHPNCSHMERGGSKTDPVGPSVASCQHPVLRSFRTSLLKGTFFYPYQMIFINLVCIGYLSNKYGRFRLRSQSQNWSRFLFSPIGVWVRTGFNFSMTTGVGTGLGVRIFPWCLSQSQGQWSQSMTTNYWCQSRNRSQLIFGNWSRIRNLNQNIGLESESEVGPARTANLCFPIPDIFGMFLVNIWQRTPKRVFSEH